MKLKKLIRRAEAKNWNIEKILRNASTSAGSIAHLNAVYDKQAMAYFTRALTIILSSEYE